MPNDKAIDQAHFVFNTGRMIHDRVFQIQARHIAGMENKQRFGDLSMAQVNALMMIRARGPLSLTELAGQLGVSPPSASAMVDRLVDKGLVSRKQSPEDRRRVVIGISPAALKEIMAIEAVVFRSFVDLVERIGPDAADQWCAVLEKIRQVLNADTAGAAKA